MRHEEAPAPGVLLPATAPNPGVAGVLGPLSEYIGYSVQCAQMAIFQDFIRTLTLVDLRPAQFSALTLIDANPGILQGRAAEALKIRKTHFVPMLAKLEERALVKRVPRDGRTNKIFLTPKGQKLLARARTLHDEHHARVVRAVGENNRTSLIEQLSRIASLGDDPAALHVE